MWNMDAYGTFALNDHFHTVTFVPGVGDVSGG